MDSIFFDSVAITIDMATTSGFIISLLVENAFQINNSLNH